MRISEQLTNLKLAVFKIIAVILVLNLSVAGFNVINVEAAANGIYLATATPHYKHPQTGAIEDSGGESSAVLGQSMTESATDTTALVEVAPQGNTYITVRLKLMDNIEDPEFQVDGSNVSATLMQEDYTNNTADYRMKVNSENSIIRCNMYVVPMGRSVIFFITVSGLHEGSGDFITSVTVESNQSQNTDTNQAQSSESQSSNASDNSTQTQTEVQTQDNTASDKQAAAASNSNVNTQPTATVSADATATPEATAEVTTQSAATESVAATTGGAASATPGKTNEAAGLSEFDKSGKEVEKKTSDKKETKKSGSHAVFWVVIGIVVVAAAGFGGWYFFIFKKKNTKGDAA